MKYEPCLVFWNDACFEEGWKDVKEVMDETPNMQVTSIGFYMKEDAQNLFLCMSRDDKGAVSDVLVIPRKMIISKVYLMEPKNVLRKM